MSTREIVCNAVSRMNDEQVEVIYNMIRMMAIEVTVPEKTPAQAAYDRIAGLRKPATIITDEDDKELYHQHLEENNVKDFETSTVKAISPDEFMDEYNKTLS